MGATLGLGFWLWSHTLPVDYSSSALLSYETPHHFLAGNVGPDSEAPTVHIADSAFSPEVLLKIADQVRFMPGSSNPGNQRAASIRNVSFRSHFDLSQPAPGLLQVTYKGRDPKQVEASANALASALVAWVAKPPQATSAPNPPVPSTLPAAPPNVPKVEEPIQAAVVPDAEQHAGPTREQKRKAADLRRRADVLDENLATLALQKQTIEGQIQKLLVDERKLKRPSSTSEGTLPDGNSARRQLEGELTIAKKRLAELRQSFADGYPDVEAMKERVAVLEQRVTALSQITPPAPAVHIIQQRNRALAKNLSELRALRKTVDSEEESDQRQSQALRERADALLQAAVPESAQPAIVVVPVNPGRQARVADITAPASSEAAPSSPLWLGHFTVLSWGDKPRPIGDDGKQILVWLGAAAALALAGMYLALAAWRFRPVTNLASLQNGLPDDVKYYGAISGCPLTEISS
jgi:hypothetical protein